MTTDPERIREWAEERDVVPVRTHGGEGHGTTFARTDDLGPDHEEFTWDEFERTVTEENLVFVYQETDPEEGVGHFDLVERDEAFERVDLGRSELEDRLRQGETVTTEIVETQVIEREIVERDTIESEVVESELADRHVVDSELLTRELVDTEFVSADEIDVTTEETRLDTVEEIERYTVESRIVDVDLEHDDELERDEIRTDVDLEGIQRSILESDVVRTDVEPDEVIEQEVIESTRGEGDTVRSELIERRTVEEEIQERTRKRFTLEETELLESSVIGSDLLEGEIVDVEEYETLTADERASVPEGTGEPGESVGGTAGTTGAEPDARSEAGAAGGDTDAVAEADADATGASAADSDATTTVSRDDQGKVVVDESGEEIGIAGRIEEGTVYVDPEPGLTDRLRARLGWESDAEDEYPVEPAQIKAVDEDEIVLRSG